jgi:hypothetical protein
LLISTPTAPTIYLSGGWTLNKDTREQKGADWTDDPVLCFLLAARVTTGDAEYAEQAIHNVFVGIAL